MTKKTTKKLITMRLRPELLKDIEDICNKTSLVSRTALIEEACRIFINEQQKPMSD